MASNPRSSPENERCRQWLYELKVRGANVFLPEISDYEIRRELLRAHKTAGLARLDSLRSILNFLPINSLAMERAAMLWAEARNRGRPTAHSEALDGDAILAAQALTAGFPPEDVVVATANLGHLGQFVQAALWADIR